MTRKFAIITEGHDENAQMAVATDGTAWWRYVNDDDEWSPWLPIKPLPDTTEVPDGH